MINILGIETSCDETAVAVVANGREILSNEIYSQIELHQIYGGVVPEIASRNHVEKIDFMVTKALETAHCTMNDIQAIAVTNRPGLVGALLVGLSFAKGLAYSKNIPLVAVNHIEAHMAANHLEYDLPFPHIGLVISGGHSHIYRINDHLDYTVLGKTLDDAVGEAFDKIARSLGLGYPGGPLIDQIARGIEPSIIFPEPQLVNPLDFSFSGLKSAVLSYINQRKMKDLSLDIPQIAASFQARAVDILIKKAIAACEQENIMHLALAGGVASNSHLREALRQMGEAKNIKIYIPSPILCTDNGAMVAAIGYHLYKQEKFAGLSINAIPSGRL